MATSACPLFWDTPTTAVTAFISEAFRNYFEYGDQIERVIGEFCTMDEWEQMIYDELNEGRPVLYGTAVGNEGHSAVIDGYQNGYFHIMGMERL